VITRGRGVGIAAFVFVVSGVLSTATAQSTSTSTPGPDLRVTSLVMGNGSGSDSAGDVEITLPSVIVSGAPRSYQVVSVPVPAAFANVMKLDVEVMPHGDFLVLGPRTRSLASSGRGRVGITIGIPASALAGRFVAAEARFSSPASATLVVPIEIDVNLVRQILLHPATAAINAQAGKDAILPIEIANTGNAVEIVQTDLTLPAGWASRERQAPISIRPGQTLKRRVRLEIPALSSTGSSFVRVDVSEKGEVLDSETMTVEVFNSGSIGSQAGPLVTSAYSHAADENGRPNSLFTLSAVGALYDSVRIDARMSSGSAVGGAASNAFTRIGSYQSSASVVLSAPSGQLSLGNTGTSFSDLTGLYPYGQGALVHVQNAKWNLTSMGALSMAAQGSTKRKPMLGLRGERSFGDVFLNSSITHLADAGLSPRRLDAFGVGAAMPSLFGSTLKAEVAERRFLGGSGIGWSSELVRTDADNTEELRLTHAPGGSDAYARATNEIVANVSERLTSRATVSASTWRTSDVTSVFTGIKSNGFSLRPQYAIREATTIAVEMRSYLFDATSRPGESGAGGAFGSQERQLGISFSSYLHQYYVNSSAYLGTVTRTVTPAGEAMLSSRTPRNYWTTNAGWSGPGGLIELQTRIEQTRDAGGLVNQQSMFGVRGQQVVLPWFGGIRGEGELQRVNGFGGDNTAIMRAGLAIPLINGFALKIDAERNSIFHSSSGRVPWIFGARFEHSMTLPMLRTPGTSGYVFEDLNGNQRRDSGEPGVPGAMVRRGPETAVADASGKYRVSGDQTRSVMVDEASLPDGWTPNGVSSGDLGVTLSTSVEVELVVALRSGVSAVAVDLSKAHVIARDSAGREWAAAMTGPTTATFESLPVGTYKLDFDLSELSEPLVPRAPLPLLIVSGKDSKSITVTLDPRPIRMWNGSALQGSGAEKKTAAPREQSSKPPVKPSGS
jgi:hypothetical protein